MIQWMFTKHRLTWASTNRIVLNWRQSSFVDLSGRHLIQRVTEEGCVVGDTRSYQLNISSKETDTFGAVIEPRRSPWRPEMATGANATPLGKLHPSIGAKRGFDSGPGPGLMPPPGPAVSFPLQNFQPPQLSNPGFPQFPGAVSSALSNPIIVGQQSQAVGAGKHRAQALTVNGLHL